MPIKLINPKVLRSSRKGVRIDALLHWEIKCASAAEGVAIGVWMDQALREVLAARRKKKIG